MLNLPRNSTTWKLSGTETFRLSSTAILDLWGTNLTNIEKSMRKLYWADEGKLLCQVDQSGAEALIVAYEAPKGKFRDLFLHGVKPHVFVAMHMFLDIWKLKFKDIDFDKFAQSEIKDLKKLDGWKALDEAIKASDNWAPSERYYYLAKQTCHSANYAIKGGAFQLNVLEKSRGKIVLTKQRSEKILYDYNALFPELNAWQRWIEEVLRKTRILHNLQGFPRHFTGVINDKMLKEAYAYTPQSTVGCITHREITMEQEFIEICERPVTVHQLKIDPKVDEALQLFGLVGKGWDLLGNCHDSSLTQCPEEKALDCARVKMFLMQQDLISSHGEKFKMRSEAQVGKNWSPWKKESNEEGLKEIIL